jgi:hypothetical protein
MSKSSSVILRVRSSSDVGAVSGTAPRILAKTASGSGASSTVVDCFRAEPLVRFEAPRSDEEESLEANDREELLEGRPGLCDVR